MLKNLAIRQKRAIFAPQMHSTMRIKNYRKLLLVALLVLVGALSVPAYYWLRYPYLVQHAEQTSLSTHWWEPLWLVMQSEPSAVSEQLLAVDCEAYHHNWAKVQQLTMQDNGSSYLAYYHNLAMAYQGSLADSLMHHYAPFERALFLPVDDKGSYQLFLAAGEAWWAVKDYTMAEHATMLGMIFSPRHTGTRALRRLAEINIAQGDSAAAAKYLRILKKCPQHRKWADAHMQSLHGLQLHDAQDTLRLSLQYQKSLRNILDNDPNNFLAHEYLLCLDLLVKDLTGFRLDVEQYGYTSSRLYEEAILILMINDEALREAWHNRVATTTYKDFTSFNNIMNQGNRELLKSFRHTYWYYYQFAQRNNDK